MTVHIAKEPFSFNLDVLKKKPIIRFWVAVAVMALKAKSSETAIKLSVYDSVLYGSSLVSSPFFLFLFFL